MIYELNHFGIVVRDLEKSLAFYQGLFDAKVVFDGFIESSKTDIRYLQIAGGMIELLHPREPGPDTAFGVTHIAFLSDALDEDYERLLETGFSGEVAPKVAGTGVGRLAFLHDPNGARVELLQRDVKMRTEPIDHPIVKAFDHYSLIANDRDGGLRFYRDALGLKELTGFEVAATNLTIDYLHYDYDVLELLHRPEPSSDPIFAHIALRVRDVDEAKAAFAEQGVEFEPGTPKPAGTGLGRIGIIRDPDGVKIELLDRADLHEL
jgi:catechol 2,3-dioxygenase-like lactoylglutathione lyase family enzyme